MRGPAHLLAACAALTLVLAGSLAVAVPAEADTGAAVDYRPPVDAPVVDPYRPPPSVYAAGNRGIDFATAPGGPVRSAAAGEVTFAGQVGASLHVVILHEDGLRTSYSFLRSVAVRRGDRVAAGATVGTAGPLLHFGARAGEAYVDPALLLGGGPPTVHLVPAELRVPQSEARERGLLRRALAAAGQATKGALRATSAGVAWARDRAAGAAAAVVEYAAGELDDLRTQLAVLAHALEALQPLTQIRAVVESFRAWHNTECTAGGRDPPSRTGRRIAVMVGGLGSAGGHAGVLDVDTAGFGYAAADVVQFSYRGGRVPGVGELTGVPVSDYRSRDSQGDLRVAGRRLRELLESIRAAHPGVPADVIAHSQGGLVARVALSGTAALDARLPEIGAVVTLGTPYKGADLATAVSLLDTTDTGGMALDGVGAVVGLDPSSPAARQLSETSGFIAELESEPLPAGIPFTSIAARGDLVVPAGKSVLHGATNVVLPMEGIGAHGDLPGSEDANREIRLALAGMPPGCQDFLSVLFDSVVSTGIAAMEDVAGVAVGLGAMRVDARVPTRPPVTVVAR